MWSCLTAESKTMRKSDNYRERLFDRRNIFLALYSVHSYIMNEELLTEQDRKSYYELNDYFNVKNINAWVERVHNRLSEIIDDDKYLKTQVYFKPKKIENKEVDFRPLHHSKLIDQITAVAMLNILIYAFDEDGTISSSSMSRLIPHNFYGNKIANDMEHLFIPWELQYKQYNKKANENYRKYHDNSEYTWEVDLDLKNFFPSVNPVALYRYIAEKLPVNIKGENREIVLKIIEKLIFIEINPLSADDLDRYQGSECKLDCRFAKGIPQGLPHSYFLANLIMIEIEKMYKKAFPKSEMFFYVDDSVIFTNDLEDEGKLTEKINEINESIASWVAGLTSVKPGWMPDELFDYVKQRESNYGICVHKDGKSTASDISKSKQSELFLNYIGRETSKTAFELNTNYSDEESLILLNKTERLNDAVEKELDDVVKQINEIGDYENTQNLESYKKKLVRYKKFFKYRKIELTVRTKGAIEQIEDEFVNELRDVVENKDLERFFASFTEDIFSALLSIVLREMSNSGKDVSEIISLLKRLNTLLFGRNNIKTSYLAKSFFKYESVEIHDDYSGNRYSSLTNRVKRQTVFYRKKTEDLRRKNAYSEIIETKNNSIITKVMGSEYAHLVEYVDKNSTTIRRMVLNAYISGIFGFDISDDTVLHKQTNREITYTELRLLEMLRSRHFEDRVFYDLLDAVFAEECNYSIDYSIFQVLGYFKTYVADVGKIDNLILVHKYTCDIWKNGSKHLYFYTLHNQEHAVELVQNAVKLVRAIDYIDLKKYDYYILFIACYLHDISMVTFPFLDSFQNDDFDSNKIYTEFVGEIRNSIDKDNLSDKSVKKMLRDYYLKVDEFYENLVRSNHAKDSAREIRKREELSFIDGALREIVAEVAEAHGYDIADIYFKKSSARNQNWSEKYTKILLRLADLLDMSSYRVSSVILNHNINNMGRVSRFHWLSHMITRGYKLEVKYRFADDLKDEYLRKDSIVETIQLIVSVDLPQLTRTDSPLCQEMNLNNVNGNSIELECGKECDSSECNFLCKWFAKKNNYLFPELEALRKYLKSIPDNYFDTRIEVIVKSSDKNILSNEQFLYLKDFVEGK